MRLLSSFLIATALVVTIPVTSFSVPQQYRPRQKSLLPQNLVVNPHDVGFALSHVSQDASSHILQFYTRKLQDYPLTTKSATASVLAFIGDAVAQIRSTEDGEKFSYDAKRGAVFLGFGYMYTGYFQTLWFAHLSAHIKDWGDALGIWGPERVSIPVEPFVEWNQWWSYFDVVTQVENPPTDAALAIGKLAVNQFGVVPFFYMPLFFTLTGALGGLDVKQSYTRARELYFPILRRNYFFWLPVQFFQFFVLPLDWQVQFVAVASLIWTVILSSIGGSSKPPASQSTIVSYEVEQTDNQEIVTVVAVDAGATNELTDDVRLEDVENALIPEPVSQALSNDKVVAGVQGGVLGLLASAADDAALGTILSDEAGIGVGIVAAIGAGVGLLSKQDDDKTDDAVPTDVIIEPPELGMIEKQVEAGIAANDNADKKLDIEDDNGEDTVAIKSSKQTERGVLEIEES